MTLVLAVDCADGLILASDSQVTFGTSGQDTRGPTQKIFCPWSNIAFGASGTGAVIQPVREALERKFSTRNRFEGKPSHEIRKALADEIVGIVRPLFEKTLIQVPGEHFPSTSFLFAGCSSTGPFIMEVHPNLLQSDHITSGYSAIGSGDIFPYFALTGLAHYNVRARPMREVKLLVYRVMDDAIRAAAHGLGPPIQMVEIQKPANGQRADSPAKKLTDVELQMISDQVDSWKTIEGEALSGIGLSPDQRGESPPTSES